MLGKPRILSLFPNSFNKFNKHEHSCKILYLLYNKSKLKKHQIIKFHVSCIHLKKEFPRETLIARDDMCIKRR